MCIKADIITVLKKNGHTLAEVEQKGYVKLESSTYEPLTIEYLGAQKDGKHYSVAQHYIVNGDLVDDPDIEYVEAADGKWYPLVYTDIYGCKEIYFKQDGIVYCRPSLKKSIEDFSRQWGSNLKMQFC